jgi:hypothetical protein
MVNAPNNNNSRLSFDRPAEKRFDEAGYLRAPSTASRWA